LNILKGDMPILDGRDSIGVLNPEMRSQVQVNIGEVIPGSQWGSDTGKEERNEDVNKWATVGLLRDCEEHASELSIRDPWKLNMCSPIPVPHWLRLAPGASLISALTQLPYPISRHPLQGPEQDLRQRLSGL
jgi:hypothetical protein